MARIAVLFGTTDGHTARVARHVANVLRGLGHALEVVDLREDALPSFTGLEAVIVAGSVRMGRFQRKLVEFVRDHREAIARLPNAFLAVSLAAAHDTEAAKREVVKTLARFGAQTRWAPQATIPVAGALLYTRYGFFKRFVMRTIARKAGGDTDTSRDYEYTDWPALTGFAMRFDHELRDPRDATAPFLNDGSP